MLEPRDRCFFIIVVVDVVLSFGVPDDVVHVVDALDVVDRQAKWTRNLEFKTF
jgi:hypothetical protein